MYALTRLRLCPSKSGDLNFVEDIGDDHVGGEVVCFGFVGEADAVTKHVVAYRNDIFGNNVSSLVEEGIGSGSLGK